MKQILKLFIYSGLFLILVMSWAQAAGSLKVEKARIFSPLKATPVTAGYAKFFNSSDKPITLKVQKAQGFKAAELHKSFEKKDGKMGMKKVTSIKIPAQASVELKPGGYHLMLFEPEKFVQTGKELKISFKLGAQNQSFKFRVVPRSHKKKHMMHKSPNL